VLEVVIGAMVDVMGVVTEAENPRLITNVHHSLVTNSSASTYMYWGYQTDRSHRGRKSSDHLSIASEALSVSVSCQPRT